MPQSSLRAGSISRAPGAQTAALDGVPQWSSLAARAGRRVLAMDGNAYLSRPGPRLIDAAEIVARWYTSGAEHAG